MVIVMQRFNPVENWLNSVAYSHSNSEATAKEYKIGLKVFCDYIGKTPNEILEEYEVSDDRTFRRKYAAYVKGLIGQLQKQGYASNTITSRVTAIKSFWKYSDLPLGYIPQARIKVTYHNRDILREEVISILKAARPRDKAFFCMMTQSGLRPSTLTELRLKHIQPDFDKGILPCCIKVPEEHSKGHYGAYFSFMGKESVEALKAYFSTRKNLTEDSYIFASYGVKQRLSSKSFSALFNRLARKLRDTGVLKFKGKAGKPAELRLYNLRKYFRKYAGQAGIEYVNFWMGHKADYKAPQIPSSDAHYFPKEDVEFHRKIYAEKAMPHLRLEELTPSETDKVIQRLEKQLTERNGEIQHLKEELQSFRQDIEYVKQLREDLEFYKEGGVSVAYIKNKISKEDVKKLIKESKKERKK